MGLPIVTSDLPNRTEYLDQAACGLAVTPDDPKAHAEAILWLHAHPRGRMMGQRAIN